MAHDNDKLLVKNADLSILNDREKQIIKWIYGIGCEPKTFGYIAQNTPIYDHLGKPQSNGAKGVTVTRVFQLQKSILKKLREQFDSPKKSIGLMHFDSGRLYDYIVNEYKDDIEAEYDLHISDVSNNLISVWIEKTLNIFDLYEIFGKLICLELKLDQQTEEMFDEVSKQ
jgi:hypothetical protein